MKSKKPTKQGTWKNGIWIPKTQIKPTELQKYISLKDKVLAYKATITAEKKLRSKIKSNAQKQGKALRELLKEVEK